MIEKIQELMNASGAKAKQAVLEKYRDDEDFRAFLYYALNPRLSYHLSEKTLMEPRTEYRYKHPFAPVWMFTWCKKLSTYKGVKQEQIDRLMDMFYSYPEPDRTIWIKLFAKTIRLGVTATTVNKVIPGLIPEWEVQQAYPIDKYPIADGTEFWLTQKLNGVRATLYKGELIARSGQPYTGLGHILDAVGKYAESWNVVFDGELTLKDKGELSDNEAFRTATGIINGDDADKTCICYTIFDMISESEFDGVVQPSENYGYRRETLDLCAELLHTDCTRVLPVLYHGTDQHKIWELLEQMVSEDKEGLMLNTNVPYYRKRHKGILKVKQFYSMDLPILRCEEGSGRLAGTLGAFVLDYQGNEVRVGSGFSDEQRRAYWQKREEIAGMLCEVKYKEISADKKTGLQSLQFPIFIRLRADKTEPSYG